jgi:hypothetical protein
MVFSKAGIIVMNRVANVWYLVIWYVRSCHGSVFVMNNLFLLLSSFCLNLGFKANDFWEHGYV